MLKYQKGKGFDYKRFDFKREYISESFNTIQVLIEAEE
jgi:hypothetical protein